mgnify:CR=1 FL=1
MKKLPLERALSLLSRRKFLECLRVLENSADLYRESFNYYLTGGLACLYLNEFGTANRYFQIARRYNVTDPQLLLGQAVLFLRVGDTARAVQYYLDVQESDPKNKTAKRALSFIREKGKPEEILRLVESNALKRFYPPLGLNPSLVFGLGGLLVLFLCVIFSLSFVSPLISKFRPTEIRFSSSTSVLSADDYAVRLDSLKDMDFSGSVEEGLPVSEKEIEKSYRAAYNFATESAGSDGTLRRTNMARFEANRLLLSPAVSESLKIKVKTLLDALDSDKANEPVFSTLLDNFSCERVRQNPSLYDGCWVRWLGRLYNPRVEDGVYKCTFFVSDEDEVQMFGMFDMTFRDIPGEPITGDRTLDVLARISVSKDGRQKISLEEKQYAVHLRNQSVIQEKNQMSE